MEQYILPFIDVCEKVFQKFCKTEVNASRPYLENKDEYKNNWDISGIIGLSGQVTGAVCISMKEVTACELTDILTRKKHETIDNFVCDAVGEIINIIVGNLKKKFEDELRIKISLPTIVEGKGHSIKWPSQSTKIICIPFAVFADQKVCLSFALEQTK